VYNANSADATFSDIVYCEEMRAVLCVYTHTVFIMRSYRK